MSMRIFSVFDSKAEAFLQPFFSPTAETALRSFKKAVNEDTSVWGDNPGDFTLFEIGDWDEHDGTLLPKEAKKNLGCAVTMITEQDPMVSVGLARFELMNDRLKAIEDRIPNGIQGGE